MKIVSKRSSSGSPICGKRSSSSTSLQKLLRALVYTGNLLRSIKIHPRQTYVKCHLVIRNYRLAHPLHEELREGPHKELQCLRT